MTHRIGMLTLGLPAPGQKRSGVDAFAHRLADGLAARGHRLTMWSYDPPPPGAAYAGRLLPARRFYQSFLGKRLTSGYLANLFHLLPDYEKNDALIVHGDSLLMPLLGRPFVRVMHGSGLGEAQSAKSPFRVALQLGIYLQEVASSLTAPCVAVSRNTLRHIPFIRTVIPNGVDDSRFTPGDGGKAGAPTILFVGTLGGRKRGAVLIDWFRSVIRPALPEAELHAVVERPGEPTSGVTYHIGIPEADLIALYRRAWVYASPSVYEGFGLPYLEAMACGTPVVATPNPGSCEVLDNGTAGILASDADFASSISELLTDPAIRAVWTARGLVRARECSFTRTLDQYEAVVHQLVGRGRTGRR